MVLFASGRLPKLQPRWTLQDSPLPRRRPRRIVEERLADRWSNSRQSPLYEFARSTLVDRFQDDPDYEIPLFVISLRAGGTGLNLTAASYVVHFDRWWNPAVEDQATDRAYRIGQEENVQVFKYTTRGTVEQRIDAMIEQKKDLADAIVTSGEQFITELSMDDLKDLFSLQASALEESETGGA